MNNPIRGKELGKISQRVLTYLIHYKRLHNGNSPSYRELMEACDLSSTSQVDTHLDRLRIWGHLEEQEEIVSRNLVLKDSLWIYHGPDGRVAEETAGRLIELLERSGYRVVRKNCCGGNCSCHTESESAMVAIA